MNFDTYNREESGLFSDMLRDPEESFLIESNDLGEEYENPIDWQDE